MEFPAYKKAGSGGNCENILANFGELVRTGE
jgi:hypothetical protein